MRRRTWGRRRSAPFLRSPPPALPSCGPGSLSGECSRRPEPGALPPRARGAAVRPYNLGAETVCPSTPPTPGRRQVSARMSGGGTRGGRMSDKGVPDSDQATILVRALRGVLTQVAEPVQVLRIILDQAVAQTGAERGVFVEV